MKIAEMLCNKINPNARGIHTEEQPGELRYSVPDISRITKTLGYHPKGILSEKIDEVIEYYKRKR